MQLDSISIRLMSYGSNEGKYEGSVRFTGTYGAVEIRLDEKLSQEVLQLCSDSLVRQARETGKLIAGSILENRASATLEDRS